MDISAQEILNSLFNADEKVCLRVFEDRDDGIFPGAKYAIECGKFSDMEETLRNHNAMNTENLNAVFNILRKKIFVAEDRLRTGKIITGRKNNVLRSRNDYLRVQILRSCGNIGIILRFDRNKVNYETFP